MNRKIPPDQVPSLVQRFKDGDTMTELAASFGVTRSAIGALLNKRGLTRNDGGQHGGARQTEARERKKDAVRRRVQKKVFQTYGLPAWRMDEIVAIAKALNGKDPRKAYRYHQNCMRLVKVKWDMDFADWWGAWFTSGKWTQRGRGPGKWIMCRKDFTKPVAVSNVEIIPYERRLERKFEKGTNHAPAFTIRHRQAEPEERQPTQKTDRNQIEG